MSITHVAEHAKCEAKFVKEIECFSVGSPFHMPWPSAGSRYTYLSEWSRFGGVGIVVITKYGICTEVGNIDIRIGRMWGNGVCVGLFLSAGMRARSGM